jgi:uncharacterized surface protein with fasciclin (FAS1) repeats
MNDLERFSSLVSETLENLFNAAKSKEELSYIFALLGLDSGMEDAGWKPISETWELLRDITSLANSPLKDDTKVRLLLLLYSQITEASFLYHVIYNMILSIDNKSARIFNFTELYRGATPPSAKSKVSQICKKAVEIHHDNLKIILEEVFDSRIRNAISHSDYILYKDEMRLKHKGGEILSIKVNDVIFKINKAIIFFENFFTLSTLTRNHTKMVMWLKEKQNLDKILPISL